MKTGPEAGATAGQLRTLAALAEDLSSVPSIHLIACGNSSSRDLFSDLYRLKVYIL